MALAAAGLFLLSEGHSGCLLPTTSMESLMTWTDEQILREMLQKHGPLDVAETAAKLIQDMADEAVQANSAKNAVDYMMLAFGISRELDCINALSHHKDLSCYDDTRSSGPAPGTPKSVGNASSG